MAHYALERLSILLVEDSPFVRSLLVNALRALGVGTIVTRDHGGEAVQFLQMVHDNPMHAGVMGIDIVMTNWEMSPVDGMMLLRWIRRHKDSPDRFVPVIMITAYSNKERVEEARLMGVTEFLTKPFTIGALSEKLVLVIENLRQFVHTRDYFGPDRRRQRLPFEGKERRTLKPSSPGVEVVRG